ncbi:hypothetical protein ADK38_05990 [Streptomyces varsoviensis]|uniref:SH3b domain-containing protein n=2 Tax=Streptomyces varsoviensis TaxID=67373 RepID=A0ABR5JCA2_9ACTN|nr:hypothetical protein ADK38_05990 [Streptomyces varsoviensis]
MTALAMTALALSGALAGTAASAAPAVKRAVDCNHSVTHENPGKVSGTFIGSFYLKDGPYAACGNVKKFAEGTKFWIWCGTYNAYNNHWAYGRVAGTETKGWIPVKDLMWGGPMHAC